MSEHQDSLDAASRGELLVYRTEEAAALLRVSGSTIRKLVNDGRLIPDIPTNSLTKGHLFTRETLLGFISKLSKTKKR